jgi:hypothetical protein
MKTQTESKTVVRILNAALNHRIERTAEGFALYDGFGYSGTFPTEREALAQHNAPLTNYDHASTPDGI